LSNWKKLVASGSHAHLQSVTASNGSIISGSLTMSGSINNVDNLNFYTTSSAAGAVGRFVWNDGDGTLDLGLKGGNVTLQLGQEQVARVYNAEATTLNDGEIVYISGSQGNRISVKRAGNSAEEGSRNTIGMITETILAGTEGFVTTNGVVNGLNTIGLTAGATLYLSTNGGYTQTKPVSPTHTVIVGFVQRVHASVGSIFVKIDNGYQLDELHNVLDTSTTASYGDLLVRSGSVWTNSKQLTGSYGITGSLQATSFTGSLQGTATTATSASFASTASFLSGTVVSASFATNSSTASFLSGTVVSASFATTASYVLNVPPPSTMNITDDNTNAVYYPVFVDGAGSGKTLYADTTTTPTSINPNTGEFKLSNTVKVQSDANGNRIAIGHNAGQTSHGTSSIAIGYNAGNSSQGNFAVAMGYAAGATSQGEYGVAIGAAAGTEGTGSTAVGYQAGTSAQGNYSVAIGYQAGVLSLGENSIAIGRNAGYNSQPAKTIVINASGSYTINYVANQTGSFYVAPIRASSYTSGSLYYNSTTNEITSLLPGTETTATSASFATTASYVRNSVSSSFATSASFATTASYVNTLTQNVTISGSVFVSGSIANVNYITFDANSSSPASLSTGIYALGNNITVTGSSINLYTNSGTVRISGTNLVNNTALVVNSGSITATNGIIATGSILVNGIVNATSFTGSLQGTATTASYVLNAVSSSFATSASFASTASFVNTLTQNVTVSGSIFLSGSLNTPTFIDYEERFSTPGISIAPSPGVLTLNLANGNVFDVALNANITTLTISNPPAANNAGSFVLIFTADGTARVVSWGASILWPGGTAPTLTSTNGKKDVFGFISLNSGTNFMGFIGGQNI